MGKQSGFQDPLFFRVDSGRPDLVDLGLCLRLPNPSTKYLYALPLLELEALTPSPQIPDPKP